MKKNLKDLYCQRPHVVIVGAGASRAVMGKSCPTMNEAIEQVGLDGILKGFMLETKSRNLEDIYSELFWRGDAVSTCTRQGSQPSCTPRRTAKNSKRKVLYSEENHFRTVEACRL